MALLHLEGFEGLYPEWADSAYFDTTAAKDEVEDWMQSHYRGLFRDGSSRWSMRRSWDGRGMALAGGPDSGSDDLYLIKILETPLSSGTRITMGCRIKFSNTSKNNEEIFRITGNASATSSEARIRLTSNNALQLQYGTSGTVNTTSNDVFEDNSWHYIEWQTVLSNTTSGSYEVRVDGVNVMSGSGVRTQQNSATDAQCFHIRSTSSSSSDYDELTLYDDWYILDDSGSDNTDFLGPVSIHQREIKSSATDQDFATFGGASNVPASINNIQLEESDATGLEVSNTANERETLTPYQMFGTTTNIYGVKLTSRAKTELGYEAIKFKHVVDSNASTDSVSHRSIYDHNRYLTKMSIFETDPNTSSAWTVNGFNAAEFGMEIE